TFIYFCLSHLTPTSPYSENAPTLLPLSHTPIPANRYPSRRFPDLSHPPPPHSNVRLQRPPPFPSPRTSRRPQTAGRSFHNPPPGSRYPAPPSAARRPRHNTLPLLRSISGSSHP